MLRLSAMMIPASTNTISTAPINAKRCMNPSFSSSSDNSSAQWSSLSLPTRLSSLVQPQGLWREHHGATYRMGPTPSTKGRSDTSDCRGGDWPPPRVRVLLVDLDVAADQPAWPVRVGRRFDTKGVRRPRLAAVVDIDGERLRSRAGRPDHGG